MPWEPIALFDDIYDHIGKRVGIAIKIRNAKSLANECLKRCVLIDRAKPTVGAEMIRRHKGIGPVI
jgi:hypothetical protein